MEPIYPISPPNLTYKSLERWFSSLLDAGAKLIQYREKEISCRNFFKNVERLIKISENYEASLVLNDRLDIAYILGLKFVHIGDKDIPFDKAKKFLKSNVKIGVSTHSLREAKTFFDKEVFYIALGPVYETSTKKNPHPVVDANTQKKVILDSPHPVVAIGGINLDNAKDLWQRGFSSLSGISVFRENPAKIYKDFLRIYKEVKENSKTK